MRLAEVQRRVRESDDALAKGDAFGVYFTRVTLYRDTLRTLLDHDISDDACQLIEAALEAER